MQAEGMFLSLTRSASMQATADPIAVNVDAKLSNQRFPPPQDAANDSLKAFPSAQPESGAGYDQPLRPVRTMLPAGSGPLPTPHAVPHQSPPKQSSRPPAVATASYGNSGSSSSSSSDGGAAEAHRALSEVSYSHVTPYVGTTAESSSHSIDASSPLISGSGVAGSPGRGRRPWPVARNVQDQV